MWTYTLFSGNMDNLYKYGAIFVYIQRINVFCNEYKVSSDAECKSIIHSPLLYSEIITINQKKTKIYIYNSMCKNHSFVPTAFFLIQKKQQIIKKKSEI